MARRFSFAVVVFSASAALGLAGAADAFTSRKSARVNPVSEQVFEVVPIAGGTGLDYWCGAGDYAVRALGAPMSAMVYVSRAMGPSDTTNRRSAVQFTLDANMLAGAEPITNPPINRLNVGDAMQVRAALSFCHQLPTGF
ncbi:hypothetical protein PXK58_08295 [Phaeobacter gallaeciensis]|uniref:hypothetical protein n=1 Tax=Rhodobacterales TaxID=204455 RepID=UPI0023802E5B|nr:hypothetical protein [Phaeobacter gallaeciensis]MDE4274311.1 hypothetical protein [Phaeobacter gallaeciensis]MDE4299551.1 hypothetical protein [Phaeobacter gallaeciensis]MDE5184715.1 hypothetical protein [Phaeobacter gallaeciensis]